MAASAVYRQRIELAADRTDNFARALRVDFAYEGVPVLSDVSLRARAGETLALVGPTGSGKTTIVSVLMRLYEIQGGTFSFRGATLEACREELRGQFALVPQDVHLFPGTVYDNIVAGDPDASEERARLHSRKVHALAEGRGGVHPPSLKEEATFPLKRQLFSLARALSRRSVPFRRGHRERGQRNGSATRKGSRCRYSRSNGCSLLTDWRRSKKQTAFAFSKGKVVERGDQLFAARWSLRGSPSAPVRDKSPA